MSSTPETDAFQFDMDRSELGPLTKQAAYAELARKLELERDQMRDSMLAAMQERDSWRFLAEQKKALRPAMIASKSNCPG